ncbi:hypothetical protein HGA91_05685 [candidate division WWE3 bacterium]|nr:hypothetical protein [candidate division WWE3 bacterium]
MIKLSEFLLTTQDVRWLFRNITKLRKPFHLVRIFILIAWLLITRFVLLFNYELAIFSSYLLSMILWKIDSRLSIGLGILCLTLIPLCEFLSRINIFIYGDTLSEYLAVYAFYFLSIGVIVQLSEFFNPDIAKIK